MSKIVKNISLINKARGNFRNSVSILKPHIFSLNYPKYSKTFISPLYQCVPQKKNPDINIIHFDGYRLIDCDTIINIKNQFKFKISIDLDGAELTNDNIQKLKYFDYIFMNKRTLTELTSEKKVEYALNKLNFLNDKHIIVKLSDK